MIDKERVPAALSAVQAVIVRARAMALDGTQLPKIADILDRAEYLVALMREEADRTAVFRANLAELSRTHECRIALTKFDQNL